MTRTLMLLPFLTGCTMLASLTETSVFQRPTVEVTGVQVHNVGLSGAELGIYFQANNPNPIGLTMSGLEYEVFLNDKPIGSGRNERPIALPKRGASSFSMTYGFSTQELLQAGLSALGEREHEVRIDAVIRIDTPLTVLQFNVTHAEELAF